MKRLILWMIVDLCLIFIAHIPDIIGSDIMIIKCFEIERGILIGMSSYFITSWILDN